MVVVVAVQMRSNFDLRTTSFIAFLRTKENGSCINKQTAPSEGDIDSNHRI